MAGWNGGTLGVCDLTFPARAREPWTLPMIAGYRVFVLFKDSVVSGLRLGLCLWWRIPTLVRFFGILVQDWMYAGLNDGCGG